MKINSVIYILFLGISGALLLYIFSLREREKNDLNFLKEKELILKRRMQSLTNQRRDIMDLTSVKKFKDQFNNSLTERIEESSSLIF
jgi:hypothetical protein